MAHEVRLAIRTLSRAPRFTIAAVAILAAALGAATSVFTVVSGVLLEPLPYREPDRLVRILASKGEGFLSGPELSDTGIGDARSTAWQAPIRSAPRAPTSRDAASLFE